MHFLVRYTAKNAAIDPPAGLPSLKRFRPIVVRGQSTAVRRMKVLLAYVVGIAYDRQ